MALIHFNSWSDIDTIQHQLNRILDDVSMPIPWKDSDGFSSVPAMELHETDEAILLQIEVPGIQSEDLDIEVTEDTVSIKGTRSSSPKQNDQKSIHSEFRYGAFSRVITLPNRVTNTDVVAEYKSGILQLTLPKTDAEKNRVVKVNVVNSDT